MKFACTNKVQQDAPCGSLNGQDVIIKKGFLKRSAFILCKMHDLFRWKDGVYITLCSRDLCQLFEEFLLQSNKVMMDLGHAKKGFTAAFIHPSRHTHTEAGRQGGKKCYFHSDGLAVARPTPLQFCRWLQDEWIDKMNSCPSKVTAKNKIKNLKNMRKRVAQEMLWIQTFRKTLQDFHFITLSALMLTWISINILEQAANCHIQTFVF